MTRSGDKKLARMTVDALLAVILVLVMATALVEEAPHEFLGIALIALMCVHLVLNRRWFATLARGRWSALRVIRAIVIVGLVACLVGQAVSAVILSKHALAFLPALPGTAIARQAHMLCSYWSFVFAFAHAGLQFKGFSRLVKSKGANSPSAAVWLGRIVVIAVACYGVYAFTLVNMGAYLLGQVEFALVDFATPLALMCARYAAIAVLVAAVFHWLRRIIEALRKRN